MAQSTTLRCSPAVRYRSSWGCTDLSSRHEAWKPGVVSEQQTMYHSRRKCMAVVLRTPMLHSKLCNQGLVVFKRIDAAHPVNQVHASPAQNKRAPGARILRHFDWQPAPAHCGACQNWHPNGQRTAICHRIRGRGTDLADSFLVPQSTPFPPARSLSHYCVSVCIPRRQVSQRHLGRAC